MIKMAIKKIYAKAKSDKIFLYICVLPSVSILIYFSLIATSQYITESKFIIRSPQQQQGGSAALGLLFKGTSFARALDDIYSAQEYLESRNAMIRLDNEIDLKEKFSYWWIDPISKFSIFGINNSNESFFKYYQKKVQLSQDSSSSILTLETYAFDPQTSFEMNNLLLNYSEEIVNRLNKRAKNDIIGYSLEELNEAAENAEKSRLDIAKFRKKNNIVDPEKQSLIQLQLISKIQDQIVFEKTGLSHTKATAPNNPNIESQSKLIDSLEKEVIDIMRGAAGKDDSLTSQSPEYTKLVTASIFAEKRLASALASYETSKNEAKRQQFYLEKIVNPVVVDKSTYPKRLSTIASYMVMLIIIWGIVRFLLVAIREHNDS